MLFVSQLVMDILFPKEDDNNLQQYGSQDANGAPIEVDNDDDTGGSDENVDG